jgi:hypothetical protein
MTILRGTTEAGVSGSTEPAAAAAVAAAARRQYLLAPVHGAASYERRGKREAPSALLAAQRVHLRIDAVAARVASSHLRCAWLTVGCRK